MMMYSRVYSQDGDGIVIARPAAITAISLLGGSADSTVILYDNASAASGTKLITIKAKAGYSHSISFPIPLNAENGVYADLTGAGAEVSVYV